METDYSCKHDSASPFCSCIDYYGEVTPEYKFFDSTKGTHSCCSKLTKYASFDPSTKGSATMIKDYIIASQVNTGCENFMGYTNITDDADLKNTLPLLYWQGLLNASLYDSTVFPEIPIMGRNTVHCTDSDNIPVFVSHQSYTSKTKDYKLVCTNKDLNTFDDIKFIDTDYTVPYKVNYLKSGDGTDCKSSTCNTFFSMFNNMEYNIGSKIYESNGDIYNKGLQSMGWFYALLIVGIIFVAGFFYFQYFRKHQYLTKLFRFGLNKIRSGLGDKIESHANNIKDSYHHFGS